VEQAILDDYQEILGYTFTDTKLLVQALTHSSVAPMRAESNERLEFLGDAVLGMVICEKLFRDQEGFLEGDLTRVKSAVVSRRTCAKVADALGLPEMLHLGKGFDRRDLPQSVASAVFESVIGAIYLDGGLTPARDFVLRHMAERIDVVMANQHSLNFKSLLQQHAQREWRTALTYEVLDEKGPDHAKAFEVCVVANGRRFASAWAHNKKDAEQLAAQAALTELGLLPSEHQLPQSTP